MQILTILVIEDEDSLLQLYRIVLEKEGFKVLTVHNGQEAWDLIENEHVDLVITDISVSYTHLTLPTILLV